MMKDKLKKIQEILIDIASHKPTGPSPEPVDRALNMLRFVEDKSREALGIIGEILDEF